MKKAFYISLLAFIGVLFLSLQVSAKEIDKITDTLRLPSNITSAELSQNIDSYISKNQKNTVGLSLAIFSDDSILYESYHGYANKEKNIRVDQNTVMEWGSATKVLVWVSVMQLVEKGELSLTQDITKYLPEDFFSRLRHDEIPLTMYNLMHHNAGWEDSMIEIFVTKDNTTSDLETTLRRSEPRQVYEPGEFTAYSNWGVALAGYIVECISGQPFYEYVHENVFDVLGMKHTALSADLSDNPRVKEQRNGLKYYTVTGEKLSVPLIYIPLYPAGMGVGTLSDFLRFAMALVPDESGKSPLFKEAQTLQDFTSTSLYYADGKTARNSHGLWARSYAVPVVGHGGNTVGCSAHLQISPSSGVGVVIMTNQASEGIYNYGILPLIFGEYQAVTANMPDVAEMGGIYQSTRTTFTGMLKWMQLTGIMPFLKSADNVLSLSPEIAATQIEPYTYSFTLAGMTLPLKASISEERTMMSIPMWDYVKISWISVIFKITVLVLFILAALYALISMICSLLRSRIKRRVPYPFRILRMINDISIIFCFINFLIFAYSFGSYMGLEFFFGTYTSVLIQGIFFIIFALIPIVFTTIWIVGVQDIRLNRKQKSWLRLSSIAGLIMTFNIIFWNWYVIW